METCRGKLTAVRGNAVCVFRTAVLVLAWTSALFLEQPDSYLPVADGCRLFVKELGDSRGPTAIVLHGGFGAEHSYLLEAVGTLAKSYRLVLFDQRGSLRSPCAADAISIQKHLDEIESLTADLNLGKVVLIGHSRGAYLALAYQQHPAKVAGLVLLGPPSLKTPSDPDDVALLKKSDDAARAFLQRPAIMLQLKREGLEASGETLTSRQKSFAWRIRLAGANVYHVERWRQVKGGQAFFSQTSGNTAAKSLPASWDFTDGLRSTACPVAVILGSRDRRPRGRDEQDLAP